MRFSALFALVFGIAATALAFALWYDTAGLLERQMQSGIRADAAALAAQEEVGGPAAGISATEARLQGDGAVPGGIYLLLSPQGERLAGNLTTWPAGVDKANTWYELPVSRKGGVSIVLLRTQTLPDGTRLLVGNDVRGRAALRQVLRTGLVWAASLMVLLGVLGALLVRSLFRRMLHGISVTARAIARGDLSRRVPLTGHGDEVDELATVINDMLERIVRLMDGVRHVSNAIAHDLRTPVTRARARLEDAARPSARPEVMHAAIERAMQDLDAITGVFEALLRIAEIEAGARRAAFAPADLAPMLRDIVDLYRAAAEERGLALRALIEPSLPVLGDRDLVQQAVANLLDNALKFSAPKTAVILTARLGEGVVEIAVADSGPGIAAKDRARVTERFYRAEAARSTAGSGLGLSLVAAVAQLHDGTLALIDNAPGLRAVITLPARR